MKLGRVVNAARVQVGMKQGVFFETDLSVDDQLQSLTGFAFRPIDDDMIRAGDIFIDKNRRAKSLVRAMNGHACYGFVKDDVAVSYVWVTVPRDRPVNVPFVFGLHMKVNPRSAYIWDYYTAPEYRGRGLYRCGLMNTLASCREMGVRRVYIYCEVNNAASGRGIINAGFTKKVEFVAVKFAGLRMVKMAERLPWICKPQTVLDIWR